MLPMMSFLYMQIKNHLDITREARTHMNNPAALLMIDS